MSRVVVVGAGLAGLTAAIRLATAGRSVTVLSAGAGGLVLSQGTVDLLGYAPDRVSHPLAAIEDLAAREPTHPYARLGAGAVRTGVEWFAEMVGPRALVGSLASNMHLPTAVGALRPTALAPPSMVAGALRDGMSVVVVGLRVLKDMHPSLIADNLARTVLPDGGRVVARATTLDMAVRDGEADSSGLVCARALDDPTVLLRFADQVAAALTDADQVVGMPAVLGLTRTDTAWRAVEERLGRPVFEIPLPPPSVPGLRLDTVLTTIARDAGVRFVIGGRVVDATRTGRVVTGLRSETAGRLRVTPADAIVFAPGGLESGAIAVDSYGAVSEPVLGLPVAGADGGELVDADYWADHPLFRCGVAVDRTMRPVDASGTVVLDNVVLAGGILAGAHRWREKSGDGLAIASAVRAADTIIEGWS